MNQSFGYDDLDRLATASGPYPSIAYTYDAHGNRQGSTYTYAANNPFRLASFGGVSLTYNANGNLTAASQATYDYTPDNLLNLSTVPGTVTQFAYDADQWRAKKAVTGGAATYYVRGPNGQLLSESSTTGATTTTRDYVYAGSRLLTVAVSETTAP